MAKSAINRLCPRIRKWVRDVRGWPELWPVQTHAIEALLASTFGNQDCLISAPTAGGKTMAALLPLMNLCVERDSKQSLGLGYRILYISPLRALINQQSRDNGDIASLAKAVGYDCTPWMSDIDSNRKSRSWEHPNGILLTTPESIEGRLLRDPDRVRRDFSRLLRR